MAHWLGFLRPGGRITVASPADTLIAQLEAADTWPLEPNVKARVRALEAFREGDAEHLARLVQWERGRDYIPDPVAGVISRAHADLLFGEEPELIPADPQDELLLEGLEYASMLPAETHRAARIASSEGEVWWHVYVDRLAADQPLIEFASRKNVVALWRAARPVAVAFVTDARVTDTETWRLVAVHEPGRVIHRLYRGTGSALGQVIALASLPDTADLPDEWRHGLGVMLAGRVLNKPQDPRLLLGTSDLQGVEQLLFALNEATTIAVEGARLTAKPRLFVDRKYLNNEGDLPAGADVFQLDTLDAGDGEKAAITAVEYSFRAQELIAYIRDLVDRIVTRTGLVPQWVGASIDGRAETGTALRVRMLPAVLTAQGKGHYWRDGLAKALQAAQLVDALPVEQGGYGRAWIAAAEAPMIVLKNPVPNDEMEEAQRLATLSAAELQSRRQSVTELHPDFDAEQVDVELQEIQGDVSGTPVQMPEGA